jgi:hypothetical protein
MDKILTCILAEEVFYDYGNRLCPAMKYTKVLHSCSPKRTFESKSNSFSGSKKLNDLSSAA